MKKTVIICIALVGLALATGAVIWLGAGQIFHAIVKIGWPGLFYVIIWQLLVYILLGLAWWIVCPGSGVLVLIWGRLVREGGVTCLPFSELGGLVFGARAVMLGGVVFARAAASSILDLICEGIGLVPFLGFGLVMLLTRPAHGLLILLMVLGLGLLLFGGVTAILLRHRIGKLIRNGAAKLSKSWFKHAPEKTDEIEHDLDTLFQRYTRVAGGSCVHVLSWFGGGGNTWIIYHLLGARPSVLDALAIESILSGVLAVGFLFPAGLGVQELTYAGIGRIFGIPASLSLALSLIRRARDISIGTPSLLLWQALEARHLKQPE